MAGVNGKPQDTPRETRDNQVSFWGLCIIPYFVLLITFAGPISDACFLEADQFRPCIFWPENVECSMR